MVSHFTSLLSFLFLPGGFMKSQSLFPALTAAAASVALAGGASAQITLDGVLDPAEGFGTAAAVQTIGTGFGDNSNELNAAFGFAEDGNLNLFLTGNLEAGGGNRLYLFLDTGTGTGFSTLPDIDGVQEDIDLLTDTNVITFDSGFEADTAIIFNEFFGSFVVNVVDLDDGVFLGGASTDGSLADGAPVVGDPGIAFAFNNSNTAGVDGAAGVAQDSSDALTATTGLELSLGLALLGIDTETDVLGTAFISGFAGSDGGAFFSNQFLGGLPVGSENLGNNGADPLVVDLSGLEGEQFFTVSVPEAAIPEPASLALVGLGGLAMLGRRRRA
ncbi:MAG: PEP-CTERM sorting domain-containing protein [Planctomycetota bacterium]